MDNLVLKIGIQIMEGKQIPNIRRFRPGGVKPGHHSANWWLEEIGNKFAGGTYKVIMVYADNVSLGFLAES